MILPFRFRMSTSRIRSQGTFYDRVARDKEILKARSIGQVEIWSFHAAGLLRMPSCPKTSISNNFFCLDFGLLQYVSPRLT